MSTRILRIAIQLVVISLVACVGGRDMTRPDLARPTIIGSISSTLELPKGVVGGAYSEQLLATGGDGTFRWLITSGALPSGLALSLNGVIYGTPQDTTTSQVTITVTSGIGSASVVARISITPRLTILTQTLPGGIAGRPYRTSLRATAGIDNVTWSIVGGRIPAGIRLSSDGTVSGEPSTPDFVSMTVEATANGQVSTRSFAFVIRPDSLFTLLNGQTTHLLNADRRTRQLLVAVPENAVEGAIYVAVSPDVASDSLNVFGGKTSGVAVLVTPLSEAPRTVDTIAGYQRSRPPVVTFVSPYQGERRPVADSLLFCGNDCTYGVLTYLDQYYAYYEDRNLPLSEQTSRPWYEEVARFNAMIEPVVRRIWGVPSDVDGNQRINILMTSNIGAGGFVWMAPCLGPPPSDPKASGCSRSSGHEWFYAGAMGSSSRTQGIRQNAGFFAATQSTDAQEYILWTQGTRFPGWKISNGAWHFPLHSRHHYPGGGWDAALGNGISIMTRNIVTKGGDSLPDGTNISGENGFDWGNNGWRYSCLSALRTCRVHRDTYKTPGMFGYWLWQYFGDGIGDRYTRAVFGDYDGDVWEQAVGLRGAQLFNMFFLSTVLDDTPLGRASGLEWPENPVPQKLPGVRSQMHELALGNSGAYFASYSGPQIVRISGIEPGKSYVLDLEFLSSTRTAVTIVRP